MSRNLENDRCLNMRQLKKFSIWWYSRHERSYCKVRDYYQKKTKNQLLAEYVELEVQKDKASRQWSILLGLVVTVVFSTEFKHVVAFVVHSLTGLALETIEKSLLMNVSVLVMIGLLLFAIAISNLNHRLLLKRYLILKQCLEEKKWI